MPIDTRVLQTRYQHLCADSAPFRSVCDLLERYVMPRVGGDSHSSPKRSEGQATWRNPDLWDATAPDAVTTLANHLLTAILPPGVKAATAEWNEQRFRDNQAAKEILEENAEIVHRELEASDLQGELASALYEYVGLGNMFLVHEVEEESGRFKAFDFTAPPVRECEFELDARNEMRTFFRRLAWTPL